jgi:hypothetical protein
MTTEPALLLATLRDIETGRRPGDHAAAAEHWGLSWDTDRPSLTRAGRQYLARGGEVDVSALTYLPGYVDDLHARSALLVAGTAIIEQFRDALAGGAGVEHARSIVPPAFADEVDDRLAVALFAAAVALLVRLGENAPAACVAEEILGVALITEATHELHHTVATADLEAAVDALDGIFDVFQDDDVLALFGMQEPVDAGLPDDHPLRHGLDVVDQRTEAWFRPFGGERETGHLAQWTVSSRGDGSTGSMPHPTDRAAVSTVRAGLNVISTPMHLTVDPEWDLIEVLAYGSVTDLIGSDRYVVLVEDHLALVLGPALDEVTGFVVRGAAKFDVLAHEDVEDIWNGPRFRVPVLGLTDASVGEILLAIGGRFAADEPTADAMHFHAAIQETEPARAVVQWQLALEAGDMKAHYALGYTLCENGAFREAYDHLRHYTEIAQNNAWAWCWYGKASAGCDLLGEARDAYERAIAIDEHETDAPELLAALDEPGGSVSSDA